MIASAPGLPFDLPSIHGERPVWTGGDFVIGQDRARVLAIGDISPSGWSDELGGMLHQVAEDDLFIDRASRRHALSELMRHLRVEAPVILEVGVGSGRVIQAIRAAFPKGCVIGADYSLPTLTTLAASLKGIPLLQLDLTRCYLPDGAFDAIVILNVLEHIEQDDEALRQIARILKPGGIAVIEVPAGPDLFDAYDRALMHFRRYSMRELRRRIIAAGLEVVSHSHLGALIYPAFWAAKKLSRRRAMAEPATTRQHLTRSNAASRRVNRVGYRLMALEAWLRRGIYFPAGIRCLVTCRKS